MKTLITTLALALSLATVTIAADADTTKRPAKIDRPTKVARYETGIYTTVTGKLHVSVDKQTGGTVAVLLKNANGTVLFSRQIAKKDTQFRTRFDLSQLTDGTYELELTNGVDVTRQTVVIATKLERTVQMQLLATN